MPNAKVLEEKRALVAALAEKMKNASAGVLVDYKGINVADDTKLRRDLRNAGVEYAVIKNTMLRFAIDELGLKELEQHLEGTTALAVSTDDAIAPAKVVSEFIKKNKLENTEVLTIKAGIVDGKVISADDVKALASLPSREVLIAKLLGSMQAPISNTVGVLQGVIRNAVYVLDAIRQKKESA